MTTLLPLLAPGAPDDPPLSLGPSADAATRCRACGRRLVVDALGWRHLHCPPGSSWLCPSPSTTLADPQTTEAPRD